MFEALKRVLREKCLLEDGKPVLVGVSGGPDSLCLLDVLHRLEYRVVVAHLNHKLRPEADEEARVVQSFAERCGSKLVLGEGDVQGYAKDHSLSIEEAGRVLRYQFLFDEAAEFDQARQPELILNHAIFKASVPAASIQLNGRLQIGPALTHECARRRGRGSARAEWPRCTDCHRTPRPARRSTSRDRAR